MKSILMLAAAAAMLAACHPTAQDSSGRTTATPADAPQTPVEPASAPASATAAVNADFTGPLQAAGTGPLWGLSIRPDGLTLTRPDHPVVQVVNPGPVLQGKTAVWTSADGAIRASLHPSHCTDGLSDRDYPYAAVVVTGAETLKGCARPVR